MQPAFPKQSGPENNRMHQYIMSLGKMMAVFPGKQFLPGKNMTVVHDLFALFPLFLVHKIADQHVQRPGPSGQFPQRIQHLQISLLLYPVIAVHHFEIQALCILHSGVDCRPVTAVLLMNGPDDCGISARIVLRNFGSSVL